MRKALSMLWLIALSACAGGGGMQSTSPIPGVPDSANRAVEGVSATAGFTARTWIIGTGASTYSYALQDLDFYANSITIDAGDTIAYQVGSGGGGDAHTISFVPPGQKIPSPADPSDLVPAGGTVVDGTKFVNSGIMFGGQTFALKFSRAGTYRILCLFHEPAMVSTVVVHAAGTAYPHDQFFYTHTGSIELWDDLDAAAASVKSFPFPAFGTKVAAGLDPGLVAIPPPDSTVLRFMTSANTDPNVIAREGSLTIKAGTILTFVNETSNEPHTVTFALAGQDDLPNMPPDPAVNVSPTGVTSIDGTKVVNSGTIVRAPGAPFQFSARFLKPGKYFYGCLYHDNSRMTGTITVTP